jgi:hypothetical protein
LILFIILLINGFKQPSTVQNNEHSTIFLQKRCRQTIKLLKSAVYFFNWKLKKTINIDERSSMQAKIIIIKKKEESVLTSRIDSDLAREEEFRETMQFCEGAMKSFKSASLSAGENFSDISEP